MVTKTDQPSPPFPIDILDGRLYDDPWETYRWLRQNAPLWYDEANALWVVSRHEDVSHMSRHPEVYSSAQGVRPRLDSPLSIISMDDPEHTRQRRIVSKGLTPRKVRELTEHMREITAGLIDEIEGKGEIDFVEEFAIHLPLIVLAELMGLDPAMRDKLHHWSDTMMAGDGHNEPDDPVAHAAAVAFGEFAEYVLPLIEKRRKEPSDDLIGLLTGAYDSGELEYDTDLEWNHEGLEDDELLMFLVLLLVAGNETTRNAITGGLMAFSRFPEEKQKLIDDPGLMESAVEEIVRIVSPVLSFHRTVVQAHDYKGVRLEEGDRVFLLYQSANRDESVFDAPDEFRVDRSPNPHLGFGIGTHYCLGANLARAEITVAFEEVFRRLRDIAAVDGFEVPRMASSLVVGFQHLPAIFTPAHAL
jgi:cytochrome P450 family 142 subfamily A polypeptide 1